MSDVEIGMDWGEGDGPNGLPSTAYLVRPGKDGGVADGGGILGKDLLGGPPPTLLPDDPGPRRALEVGEDPLAVAARYPASSLGWADLAERALADDRVVDAYAYARTGYHRGLDALRRNGWKGHGPIPWAHGPNRGFLRCLSVLGRAAAGIGEADEAERCAAFLADSDLEAVEALG
jgi:hypothetical protein